MHAFLPICPYGSVDAKPIYIHGAFHEREMFPFICKYITRYCNCSPLLPSKEPNLYTPRISLHSSNTRSEIIAQLPLYYVCSVYDGLTKRVSTYYGPKDDCDRHYLSGAFVFPHLPCHPLPLDLHKYSIYVWV